MSNTRIQSIEHTARDRKILRRRQNGETCRSIATDMKLSPERIRQIAKRGLTLSQRAAALSNANK
jgi:DNA-directed RNA polymerase sigma subunit (sigma70/sigma32)